MKLHEVYVPYQGSPETKYGPSTKTVLVNYIAEANKPKVVGGCVPTCLYAGLFIRVFCSIVVPLHDLQVADQLLSFRP